MAEQTFDLGDVLTITTGAFLSREGMGAVYGILNYLTGDDVFTHQIPRVMAECRPHVLADHPDLEHIEAPDWGVPVDPSVVFAWVDSLRPVLGDRLALTALAPADHTRIDPLSELGLLGVPAEKILVVPPPAHTDESRS